MSHIPFTLPDIFPFVLTQMDLLPPEVSEIFQEMILFLISFLESIQFQPSIGELKACAKLLSVLGA